MRIRRLDSARWRQLPLGFRDQTADEVAVRRHVEDRLRELFTLWGYVEVMSPTLEFLETFTQGAGPGIADRLLKLVDSGGEVLALRPEMTVPLARFASMRLLPAGLAPLRLAYVAPVFRGQDPGSGRPREFTQAGVELIGDAGPEADIEVIALAAEALRSIAVPDPTLHVGHAGFVRGLLSTLPDETAETARERLYRKAFADLHDVVPVGSVREALRVVPTLRGADALDRAAALALPEESREALTALRDMIGALRAHARDMRIDVDLSLIRDFDYYSGMVFEAYAGAAGMALLGGGRYDGLLDRFGQSAPATGFAIGVDRVATVTGGEARQRPIVVVRYAPQRYGDAVEIARGLRAAGVPVVVAAEGARSGVLDPVCVFTAGEAGLRVAVDGREHAVVPEAAVEVIREALGGYVK